MPYYITNSPIGCDGWATVKDDGEIIGCHTNKDAAIAQMVAVSIAEGIEPGGERALPDNYRPSLSEDVPQGRACGNCAFYDETNTQEQEGALVAWCHRWDDYVRGDFYCNAWQEAEEPEEEPEEEIEDDESAREVRQVDLSPPEYMRDAARRGLELYADGEGGDGLQPATVRDAREMAAGRVSEPKWRRIGPWIARHIDDLDAVTAERPVTPGLVAHLLWGSGPTKSDAERAQRYAEGVVERLDAEQERADAPAPKKDQITGSDENEPGSAAGKAGNIELDEATETALQNKATTHNEKMSEENEPEWTRVRVGALKSVYRRGAGAYSTSHRPGIGRAQWAMARVNAFLYLARTGAPENASYVGDNDLLHPDHPKYAKAGSRAAMPVIQVKEQGMSKIDVSEVETRQWVQEFELRQMPNGKTRFTGYAAVFNSDSEPLPFIERIMPGAFDKTLRSRNNVKMYLNHDSTLVLASTRAKTLKLSTDQKGLYTETELPDTSYARDLAVMMERGDVDSMSFGFSVPRNGDRWSEDGATRELREVRLHEVSVVTGFPAYRATSATIRSIDLLAEKTGADANKLAHALTMLENGKELNDDDAALLSEAVTKLRATPAETPASVSVALKHLELMKHQF